MITKIEECKEYQEAIKRKEALQVSLKAEKEDLYRTKERLTVLDKNLGIDDVTGQPNWDKIESCKRTYLEHKRKVDILTEEIEKFDRFKKIKEEVKPEIIKSGQALNKRFLKALKELVKASEDWDNLRDLWAEYDSLNPSNKNAEPLEAVIGPRYGRQLAVKESYFIKAFEEASKKYQGNHAKVEK
jgi:hypothetical protein